MLVLTRLHWLNCIIIIIIITIIIIIIIKWRDCQLTINIVMFWNNLLQFITFMVKFLLHLWSVIHYIYG